MKFNLKKELPIIFIVLLPFVYLAFIWNSLPEEVPIHWNGSGEIDGWGPKITLLLIPFVLPFLIYIIFLSIPAIDPKGRIKQMGNKFYHLKFFLTLFMSLLAVFILYSSKEESMTNMSILFALMGFFILVLGNYFKTLRPNYFIGIRTPWTLENETVWKETHIFSGKLWFVGGILLIILSLLLTAKFLTITFTVIVIILAVLPIAYSYMKFKSLKTTPQTQ